MLGLSASFLSSFVFLLMFRRPPSSTPTDTLCPSTTLFRSPERPIAPRGAGPSGRHRPKGSNSVADPGRWQAPPTTSSLQPPPSEQCACSIGLLAPTSSCLPHAPERSCASISRRATACGNPLSVRRRILLAHQNQFVAAANDLAIEGLRRGAGERLRIAQLENAHEFRARQRRVLDRKSVV